MIRRKPEKAVRMLLDRLMKVKKWAVERSANESSLASELIDGIEVQLKSMKNLYPSLKLLEDKARDQFCALEQQLYQYERTFKEPENADPAAEVLEKLGHLKTDLGNLNEMAEKLGLLKTDLGNLKEMVDKQVAEVNNVTSDLGEMLNNAEISAPNASENKAMSEQWANLKIEEKVFESEFMSSLLASFRRLESFQVKMCLLFLSVFPENRVIMRRPIIYWWIGEGIVTKKGTETAEEIGEQVFQQLLNQGFIKRSNGDNSSITVKSFIVHPWIRLMLILAAKENNFLTFSDDGSSTPVNDSRRAFLCGGEQNQNQNGDDNSLLTVFNVKEKYLGIKSDWLSKLKKVEVLQLGRWENSPEYHIEVEKQDELLKGLGPQKHLKYLSLRGISLIETLPDSIANLSSLEILDLKACHNLDRLPPAIATLVKLTHLDVSECYLLESMPKGLEYLRSLQVLKGFVIGKEWRKSCRIRDLSGQLTKLRKLTIRIGNNEGAQGQLSQLNDFPALQILTISWGVISSNSSPFQFTYPASLRKLHLRCSPKLMLPENQLLNLEKLYITGGGINLEDVPKGLTTVKFLRFKYLETFSIANERALVQWFPKYVRCEIIKRGGQSLTFTNNGKAISLSPSPS